MTYLEKCSEMPEGVQKSSVQSLSLVLYKFLTADQVVCSLDVLLHEIVS